MNEDKPAAGESPIACRIDPFSAAQRERWKELGERWRASVVEIAERPDGYALRLGADAAVILAAAEWMTLDRLCCPFFRFTLEIEPEGGDAWLRLSGRPGTKEFIAQAVAR